MVDARLEQELCACDGGETDTPLVADIPVAGTSIKEGEPIVTVFARGKTSSDVKEGLRTAIAEVKRRVRDV